MSGRDIMAAVVAANRKLDDERGVKHPCLECGHECQNHAERIAHAADHRAQAEADRARSRAGRTWDNEAGEWR